MHFSPSTYFKVTGMDLALESNILFIAERQDFVIYRIW